MRSLNDAIGGLYGKFYVSRTDGGSAPGCKHHDCSYFVLDLDHNEFAPAVLERYATQCAVKFPRLAADLFKLAATLKDKNV